jgi:hypothetical protein
MQVYGVVIKESALDVILYNLARQEEEGGLSGSGPCQLLLYHQAQRQ